MNPILQIKANNQSSGTKIQFSLGCTIIMILVALGGCGKQEEASPPVLDKPKDVAQKHVVPNFLLGEWTSNYAYGALHQYRFLPDNTFVEIVNIDGINSRDPSPCFQQMVGVVTAFETDLSESEKRLATGDSRNPILPDFRVEVTFHSIKMRKEIENVPECRRYAEAIKMDQLPMPREVLWFKKDGGTKIINSEIGTEYYKDDI